MPEDEAEETEVKEVETEEQQFTPGRGYKCVNCETEVEVDPVDDKIICPKCSHRVLMKKRPEDSVTVKVE
jgi:DNA-directed RNA polymerase subunit RPC12/RpoP